MKIYHQGNKILDSCLKTMMIVIEMNKLMMIKMLIKIQKKINKNNKYKINRKMIKNQLKEEHYKLLLKKYLKYLFRNNNNNNKNRRKIIYWKMKMMKIRYFLDEFSVFIVFLNKKLVPHCFYFN